MIHSKPRYRSSCRLGMALVSLLMAQPATAQLDSSCTVTSLNRGAQVRPDGSFYLSDIPADGGPVRVRATCLRDEGTDSGASGFFELIVDDVTEVPPILFDPPPIPNRLEILSPVAELAGPGATVQLGVLAHFADGTSNDVTGVTGTVFNLSNPALATLDAGGQLTALAGGTVLVTALHEGALGLRLLSIAFPEGADSDGDGIPDDVELALGLDPANPVDGFQDLDGDRLANSDEILLHGSDPENPDSDADGIDDGEEVELGADGWITSPLLADTDGDLFRDALEIQIGTDPTDATSFDFAAGLADLAVDPTAIVFSRGVRQASAELSRQLTVTGTLLDGTVLDLTDGRFGTDYSSDALAVCSFGEPDGRVFAGESGGCVVTVALADRSLQVPVAVRNLPETTSTTALGTQGLDVVVARDVAHIALGAAGLALYDVSDPVAPALLATAATAGEALQVSLAGPLALVADGAAGLAVVDVADPGVPTFLGGLGGLGDVNRVAADAGLVPGVAYLGTSGGLVVVDLGDPSAPTALGTPWAPGVGELLVDLDLHPSEPLLAVVTEDTTVPQTTVRLFDLVNPRVPTALGAVTLPVGERVRSVAVGEGFAVTSATVPQSFRVVDLANPTAPTLAGSLPLVEAGLLNAMAIDRELIFGADAFFSDGVPILDVADLSDPVLRAFARLPGGGTNGKGIDVDGSYFYMVARSQLWIAQYEATEDTAGIAPTATIVEPTDGDTLAAGSTFFAVVDAFDDVAVASVSLRLDGELVATDAIAPFAFALEAPPEPGFLTLGAEALDFGGNVGLAADIVVEVVPNEPPTLDLVEPAVDAMPLEGTAIDVVVTADDTDGTVAAVTFVVDGVEVLVDPTAPYETTVPVPVGATSLVLDVTAVDDDGAPASVHRELVVTPDPPPVVELVSPAEGASFLAQETFTITALASDNRPLQSVVIRVDGAVVFDSTTPPFTVDHTAPLGVASLDLDVTATDDLGRTTTVLRTVTVVPSDPPTVTILEPADGAEIPLGSVITVLADASDDVGVARVRFFVDGVPIGEDTLAPYTTDFEPTEAGEPVLSAVAVDGADQESPADTVTITVLEGGGPTALGGRVVDDAAIAVAGATVRCRGVDGSDLGETMTDGDGLFALPTTPTGALICEAAAFDATVPRLLGGRTPVILPTGPETDVGELYLFERQLYVGGQLGGGSGETLRVDPLDGTLIEGLRSLPLTGTVAGLVFADPTTLWAVVSRTDSDLFTLDPASGDVLAQVGVFDSANLVAPYLLDLAYDPAVGELLASARWVEGGFVVYGLYRIDPATGNATRLGEIPAGLGLDFGPDGRLYFATFGATQRLETLDPATGAVLPGGVALGQPYVGLGSRPVDGVLYAVTSSDTLWQIDPATGTETLVGSGAGLGRSSVAFRPAEPGTRYSGRVVDGLGVGLDGAEVRCRDARTASRADGSFDLVAPARSHHLRCVAELRTVVDGLLRGRSAIVTPVAGGVTELGDVVLGPASAAPYPVPMVSLDWDVVVTLDADGDGHEDLASIDRGADVVSLSLGRGDGSFEPARTFATGRRPVSLRLADVDVDGIDDVLVGNGRDRDVSVLLGRGDGTFAPDRQFFVGTSPDFMTIGDLDGDGLSDVAVLLSTFSVGEVLTFFGQGDGSFVAGPRIAVGAYPRALVAADVDGDGLGDLVVYEAVDQRISILRSTGGGTFTVADTIPGLVAGLGVADVDGNGTLDVVAQASGQTAFHLGRGEGTFRSGACDAAPELPCLVTDGRQVSFGDLDNDGRLDVVTGFGSLVVHLGTGGGHFEPVLRTEPTGDTYLVADLNGDGIDDLAGDSTTEILLGLGDGTFETAVSLPALGTGGYEGVTHGDLDGDGVPDLVAAGNAGVEIHRGLGDGTFEAPRSSGAFGQHPALADVDGDGILDLALTDFGDDTVVVVPGLGGGLFGTETRYPVGSVPYGGAAVADLDTDGDLDLAVVNYGDDTLSILFGAGDGTFAPATNIDLGSLGAFCPFGIAAGDLDGDGRTDLVTANQCSDNSTILLQRSGGTFSRFNHPMGGSPAGVALGDVDADGDLDLIVTNPYDAEVSVALGNGNGTFALASRYGAGYEGSQVVAIDLDGDGIDDIATANQSDSLSVLISRGDGTFEPEQRYHGGRQPETLTAVDLDGDGQVDLVPASWYEGLRILFRR